jgi:alpha-amylase
VVVGLDLTEGPKSVSVSDVFENGTMIRDAYSGVVAEVTEGSVTITSEYTLVLLESTNE